MSLACPSTSSFSSIFPSLPSCDSDTSFDSTRAVRFQNQCILIPECPARAKRPLIPTKSYSLPLWPRGRRNSKTTDCEDEEKEKEGVVWKVAIPTFKRSPPNPPVTSPSQPLSPCLVHKSPTASPTSPKPHPFSPQRSASVSGKPRETVPLRSCCPNCVRIAEQSVRSGDDWQVKFSHGAQKRIRSLAEHNHKPISEIYLVPQVVLNVDEVDKRRKSLEQSDGPCCHPRVSSAPAKIQEEDDEQMLFPLPSPKRSPSSSPSPRTSPCGTPRTSPTPSTSSLKESALKPRVKASTSSLRVVPSPRIIESPVETEVLASVPPISRPHPISTIQPSSPPSTHTRGASSPASPTHRHFPSLTINIPRRQSSGPEDLVQSLPSQPVLSRSPPTDSRARSMSPERAKRRRPSLSAVTSGVLKAGADVIRGVGSMNGPGMYDPYKS